MIINTILVKIHTITLMGQNVTTTLQLTSGYYLVTFQRGNTTWSGNVLSFRLQQITRNKFI